MDDEERQELEFEATVVDLETKEVVWVFTVHAYDKHDARSEAWGVCEDAGWLDDDYSLRIRKVDENA